MGDEVAGHANAASMHAMDNEILSLSTSVLFRTANGAQSRPTTTARDRPRPKWPTARAKRNVTAANTATWTAAMAGRVQTEASMAGNMLPTAPSTA